MNRICSGADVRRIRLAVCRFLTGTWGRLLGYLARADVVVLYLARRILLDAAEPAEPSLPG